MVYEMGKQKVTGPKTFAVEVTRPEPQEPRTVVVKIKTEKIEGGTFVVGAGPQEPQQHTTTEARAFYTIPQLAELLQVHENTIYRLVRAGKVEHYKVGAQIRISAAELERLKVERKS